MFFRYFIFVALPVSFFYSSVGAVQCQNREEAFYAISSLRFYLETLQKPSQEEEKEILFEESDVAYLWSVAIRDSGSSASVKAYERYVKAVAEKDVADRKQVLLSASEKLLKKSWKELNKAFFDSISTPEIEKLDQSETGPFARFYLKGHKKLKNQLDAVFGSFKALKNFRMLEKKGFSVVSRRPSSMYVVKHSSISKYLMKLYFFDDKGNRLKSRSWAIKRCLGVEKIRRLISEKNLFHFSTPRKWIYILPEESAAIASGIENRIALIATNMNLVSRKESFEAWKTVPTKEHLRQLYCILSRGFSSCYLPGNIPYTRNGKFACIDTETPQRKLPYNNVKKYLSEEMALYWDQLVKSGGNTAGFDVTQTQ